MFLGKDNPNSSKIPDPEEAEVLIPRGLPIQAETSEVGTVWGLSPAQPERGAPWADRGWQRLEKEIPREHLQR